MLLELAHPEGPPPTSEWRRLRVQEPLDAHEWKVIAALLDSNPDDPVASFASEWLSVLAALPRSANDE